MRKKKKNLLPKVATRYTKREIRGSKKLSEAEEKYSKLEKMYGNALENLSKSEEKNCKLEKMYGDALKNLSEFEERYGKLEKMYGDALKNLSEFGERYGKLEKMYGDVLKNLSEFEEKNGEEIERFLKNEAYAFLLAEGLLDKFLEFRGQFCRTKTQEVLYTLVASADPAGLWVEI